MRWGTLRGWVTLCDSPRAPAAPHSPLPPPPDPSCVPSSPPPWGAVDSLGASLSSLNPGGVAVADAAALRLPGPRNAERLLAVRDVAMVSVNTR